jgi:hypothetical protein
MVYQEKLIKMIIHYKLGKFFGPSMVFAGHMLMVFGILTLYFTITSLGLVCLGAIMAFTTSETLVDTEKRSYKSYLQLFGLLPIGKELSFDKDDTIEVKKFRGKYITYSTSNRQSSIEVSDYRVYLIKADSKKKNLLARFEKEDEAMEESRNIMALIP